MHRAVIISIGQYLKNSVDRNMDTVAKYQNKLLSERKTTIKLRNNFGRYLIVKNKENSTQNKGSIIQEQLEKNYIDKKHHYND